MASGDAKDLFFLALYFFSSAAVATLGSQAGNENLDCSSLVSKTAERVLKNFLCYHVLHEQGYIRKNYCWEV